MQQPTPHVAPESQARHVPAEKSALQDQGGRGTELCCTPRCRAAVCAGGSLFWS